MSNYYGLSGTTPWADNLTLERRRYDVQAELGMFTRSSMKLEQREDIFRDRLIYRLTADVLAEKLPPERIERTSEFFWEFPASPFQHWKQKHDRSWWLRWFVARRPVRRVRHAKVATLEVNLERYRTFPQCNYVFPKDLGPYVNVAVVRSDWSQR